MRKTQLHFNRNMFLHSDISILYRYTPINN